MEKLKGLLSIFIVKPEISAAIVTTLTDEKSRRLYIFLMWLAEVVEKAASLVMFWLFRNMITTLFT